MKKPPRKRNPVARSLADRRHQAQRTRDRKKYDRTRDARQARRDLAVD